MNAREVMTKDVVSVRLGMPLPDVARFSSSHRINSVPVVDDPGALVGIVSEGDLITSAPAGAPSSPRARAARSSCCSRPPRDLRSRARWSRG
jgi:CBS domain-containing protein